MGLRLACAVTLLFGAIVAASGEFAAAQEPTDDKDQVIQKLLERVEALERQVAALEQIRTPQPAPQQTPSDDATQADAPTQPDNASRFNFHGYADVDFQRDVDCTPTKKF